MSYQPTLSSTLVSLDAVKFLLSHGTPHIRIDDDTTDTAHSHDFYEIYVNVSGDVSFLVRNNIYHIRPGDAIITAPGDVHYCIFRSSCLHDHYCLWFDVTKTSCIGQFLEEHDLFGHVRANSTRPEHLTALLDKLQSDTENDLESLHTFLSVLQLLKENRDALPSPAVNIPDILCNILSYIDQSYAQIQQVREIAEYFHISISTLNRLFVKYVQLSPYVYLKNKKLAFAEKLLTKGYSVTEACYATGFNDCSRFIKYFKEKYNTTPLQYVKQQRQ